MSDINNVTGSNYTSEPTQVIGDSLATGALRRKYNFGDKVSELALAQDPFFRFVSKVAKRPTDDPQFKFTEQRSSYTKRYGLMSGFSSSALAAGTGTTVAGSTTDPTAGDVWTFKYHTDYSNNGNLQNKVGRTNTYYAGVTGTQPLFFLPGQVIKMPTCPGASTYGSSTVDGYQLWKINSVDLDTSNYAIINATCIKNSGAVFRFGLGSDVTGSAVTMSSTEAVEPYKHYVVGSAHAAGSGYPETWADQPYSVSTGQTQIFKTSAVMNNTDRATVLKYQANEWARIWKEKLIEHKWDIEQAMLFGQMSSTYNTTQGAVDFITQYGNVFSLAIATKTQDEFLDDLSAMLDPRYNNSASTVFFCSTAVYNWLHKLSGYFQNNIEISPNFKAEMSLMGKKKVFGVDISTISTVYGDMNVARNVHLDGTSVKMIGINMKHCAYRPLVGNGLNRDTSVYVGVQTLENSGVDRRVDQILTEAGMEFSCPETHSIWS